jgi:hypothetical protein
MVALNKFTGVARRGAYGSLCLGAWTERGPFPFPATGTILVRGSILPLPWSARRSCSRTCRWGRVFADRTLFKYLIGRQRGFQRCR